MFPPFSSFTSNIRSLFWPIFLWSIFAPILVHGYIPASPANDTGSATNGSLPSHLDLQWYGGGYQEDISYQLVGADSSGISKVCPPF